MRLNHMTRFIAHWLSHCEFIRLLLLKMAEEREPPPLQDAAQTDFTELEDGEDLFVSTVSVIEVRRHDHNDSHSLSADSLFSGGDLHAELLGMCLHKSVFVHSYMSTRCFIFIPKHFIEFDKMIRDAGRACATASRWTSTLRQMSAERIITQSRRRPNVIVFNLENKK